MSCGINYKTVLDNIDPTKFYFDGGEYFHKITPNDDSKVVTYWKIPQGWEQNTQIVRDFIQIGDKKENWNFNKQGSKQIKRFSKISFDPGQSFYELM